MKSVLKRKRVAEDGPTSSGPRSRKNRWEDVANQTELSATELRHLSQDTRNWLTALQSYCDLLRFAIVDDSKRWVMELSGTIGRGQELVASMLNRRGPRKGRNGR